MCAPQVTEQIVEEVAFQVVDSGRDPCWRLRKRSSKSLFRRRRRFDLARQRAKERRLAAEVEQSQTAERAVKARFRVERVVYLKKRKENEKKHETLKRQTSETDFEKCVMTKGLRRQNEIWTDFRVLVEDSMSSQCEAAVKAGVKENARVKFIEIVSRRLVE